MVNRVAPGSLTMAEYLAMPRSEFDALKAALTDIVPKG